MSLISTLSRAVLLLLCVANLTACHSIPASWFSWLGYTRQRPAPQPVPIASDRLVLSSPTDDVVGQLQVVVAGYNDTLPDIARRFNLGYEEIVAANPGVSIDTPRGMRIVLPTQFILPPAPRRGIVINLATLRLFYFPPTPEPDGSQVVITHPVGIGREGWTTPLGQTRIVSKEQAPRWYVPASIRREHATWGDPLPSQVPPGPRNPLGTHALHLARPGYLIHGTNKPGGIGMRVSHGCIQLYPEDIVSLYAQVPVGTPVTIVNQPVLAGWYQGTLYLEAHPPLQDDHRNWRKAVRPLIASRAAQAKADQPVIAVDWDKVNRLVAKPRGLSLPVLVGTPTLEEILASTPVVDWGRSELAREGSVP